MEVKPLKTYRTPIYPEKYKVLENPAILKALPERWKGNAKVGIALSSALMLLLTGCVQKAGETDQSTTPESSQTAGNRNREIIQLAPVFEHGEGRGSFGCVSVAPPAFLSEAEAFEVISEEAKKEGIVLQSGGPAIEGAEIPVTSLAYTTDEASDKDMKSLEGTLELDGYDSQSKIGFEFVSVEDIENWQDKDQGIRYSVDSYDAIGTAKRLNVGLIGRKSDAAAAIFYDPMGFNRELFEKYQKEFEKISSDEKLSEDERSEKWGELHQQYKKELKDIQTGILREQVKDFLQWLKAQGII